MHAQIRRSGADHLQEMRILAGAWLRELREKRGLSQRGLAERVGVDCYTIVSQLESGRGHIPWDCYLTWADALGVPPAEFVRKMCPIMIR